MTRELTFVSGIETSELPTYTDPSDDRDFVTKGWFEGKGARRDMMHAPVATVQNARDIDSSELVDKMLLFIEAQPSALYRYDTEGTGVDDGGTTTITPTGAGSTGRWKNIIPESATGSLYRATCAEAIDGSIAAKSIVLKVEKTLYVDGSNKYLNIKEDAGSEVTITVPEKPYLVIDLGTDDVDYDLVKVLQDLLNADTNLAGVYTVSYSATTRLITISAVGPTTISILWKTGTNGSDNADNSLASVLSYDDSADDTGSLSYAADDTIDETYTKKLFCWKSDTTYSHLKYCHGFITADSMKLSEGRIYFAQSVDGFTLEEGEQYYTTSTPGSVVKRADTDVYSQYAGFAETPSKLVCAKSDIKPIQNPDNWLSATSTKDYLQEMTVWDMHENTEGKGVRISCDPVGSGTSVYKIQYKLGAGLPWQDASTTISGSNWFDDNKKNGSYHYNILCHVDENGHGILAVLIYGIRWHVHIFSSTDLSTWTDANGGSPLWSHADNMEIYGIACRENKAFVSAGNVGAAGTYLAYSDNSGSGYTSWTTTTSAGFYTTTNYDYCHYMGIQYFPAETGANKYRFIMAGRRLTDGYLVFNYCKGDMTGNTTAVATSYSVNPLSGAFDLVGNRLSVLFAASSSSASRYVAITNDSYNGGTLTTTLTGNIQYGGIYESGYNGFSSALFGYRAFIHNQNKRGAASSGRVFFIFHEEIGATTQTILYYNMDAYGAGTWNSASIGFTADHDQECCIAYVPSINCMVAAWKHIDSARTNNLVNGKMYAKVLELTATGYVDLGMTEIDGGKAMAGQASFLMLTGNVHGATAVWEQNNGSYGVWKDNAFV